MQTLKRAAAAAGLTAVCCLLMLLALSQNISSGRTNPEAHGPFLGLHTVSSKHAGSLKHTGSFNRFRVRPNGLTSSTGSSSSSSKVLAAMLPHWGKGFDGIRRRGRRRSTVVWADGDSSKNEVDVDADGKIKGGEEVSFGILGLSKARFPDNWKSPDARVTYKDSPIDRHLIGLFTKQQADNCGQPYPPNPTYDDFIQMSYKSVGSKNGTEQSSQSLGLMKSFLPPGGAKIFQEWFPVTKSSYEINAKITETAFSWMVGPMTVQETTENDDKVPMKATVKIHKCRWLQESACTGMCVNMCKRPTQDFFAQEFGLPLTIRPNFEDKSCEFCFGLTPPPEEDDPAYSYPCHVRCATGVQGDQPCHKLK